MGHAQGHAHGHGTSISNPSKATKAIAVSGLQSALGDRTREMQAIAPLQLDSPGLYEICGKLVDGGNGDRALKLISDVPTRMSGGLLAFIIVAPLVLAGVIVAVVLALTLGRR